ncbi:MAG: ribonuclease R [Bacillota bacterium]|nr:ribonuclease R [Bacillota bacterium]
MNTENRQKTRPDGGQETNPNRYVGILRRADFGGELETTGRDRIGTISIPPQDLAGAPFGMLVVVELTTPADASRVFGRVLEVLGDPGRPDVAILGIIRAHGLADRFPDQVLEEAGQLPTELDEDDIQAELGRGRRDLRMLRTITIDGEDAKDIDDAISIEAREGGGWRLWVHIADVAHYVPAGGAIDREALKRGNSVYLVDRVLPMLPPRLSNGICSLNPHVDRFALTCMIEFDSDGEELGGEVFESVIRSDLRANYRDVFAVLERRAFPHHYRFVQEEILMMQRLAGVLSKKRGQAGTLEFEMPETVVTLDEEGRPVAIAAAETNEANDIIEAFMISANIFVARRYTELKRPFIYRVHEEPDLEKIERFNRTARLLGFRVRFGRRPQPLEVAQVLRHVRETPFAPVLNQLLLQALAKARYDARPLGHYGLALYDYCHFTAPIRRYADLFIHREIKRQLAGLPAPKDGRRRAEEVADHVSDTERAAMQAEFDSIAQKVAEYMAERIGEHYPGMITGIISAGLFVRLENMAEGMVPFRTMGDYYVFDPDTLSARGERRGRTYRVGDAVMVAVAGANLERRQVDFILPDDRTQERPERDERRWR